MYFDMNCYEQIAFFMFLHNKDLEFLNLFCFTQNPILSLWLSYQEIFLTLQILKYFPRDKNEDILKASLHKQIIL